MAMETCNLTICKQTILSSPGIIQDGNYTIYCGGHFFDKQGALIQPVASVPDKEAAAPISSASVWVPYIVVGVGMLICLILVFLIFSPKPRMSVDATFSQLQRLGNTGFTKE
jgi:hypothetical protein